MRVLILDLDTLRPDHLGCYGYARNTSPHIDAIAKKGVRFENYYCADAPCLPSRAGFYSGRFGIHTGLVNHGGECADPRSQGKTRGWRDRYDRQNLAAIFQQAGYHTATISPFGQRHASHWFYAGFNEIHNTGKGGAERADEVAPVALKWLEENADKDNWLLHVNFWDAHTEYRTPASFGNPFANEPLPAWITEEVLQKHIDGPASHNMWNGQKIPWQFGRSSLPLRDKADLRKIIDGYDCGIAYMDQYIGQLFSVLQKKGLMEDLAIIITADHGENMGELGIYGEHATADQATSRIPMIIKWPGGLKDAVNTGLHYNVDLAPTLAGLSNLAKKPDWDGKSFAPSILKGERCGYDYLVLSQLAICCQRSVRFDDWLYIRTYHDGYYLFPDEMLFNLKDDPYEQTNLAEKKPEICEKAAKLYLDWHDKAMRIMPDDFDADPLWTVMKEGGGFHGKGFLPLYCEKLEASGRGWAVPLLKEKHPEEWK